MKKNSLEQREKINFGFETSKGYMLAVIILFHVVPLLFIFMGDNALGIIGMVLMMVNPTVVFILGLIFGIKIGFTWKFPVFIGAVFLPSYFMYYASVITHEEVMLAIMSTAIYTLVYLVFAFIATAVGGLLKRFF